MPDSHASVAVSAAPTPSSPLLLDPDETRKQSSASSARREPTTKSRVPNRRLVKTPRDKLGKYRAPSTTATSAGSPDANSVLAHSPEAAALTGGLDSYREGCLKLEKVRHARVYEAEKRRLFYEHAIWASYRQSVDTVLDEFRHQRRLVIVRLLCENAEKMKALEELRYKIVKEEPIGGWQKKHEMSLRGRVQGEAQVDNGGANNSSKLVGVKSMLEEDGVLAELEREKDRDKSNRRSRKNDSRQKVKLHLQVEEADALSDLADIRGEKRQRESEPAPTALERKSKRRK